MNVRTHWDGKNAKSFDLRMSDSGTLLFYWIHSFSMKSVNVTKSRRRTWLTNTIPFHPIAFQFVTQRKHCTHTVRQIGPHFNFTLLFHLFSVETRKFFLRTGKWIWWSYLMALCSRVVFNFFPKSHPRFDYDLEKWVSISFPTFNNF